LIEGIITKGVGGFYYVKTNDRKVYQCKARGLFRKDGTLPYVGDKVIIEAIDETEAVIVKIKPRKNVFIRPPVANVDCFLITIAIKEPEPNFYIIDKLLTAAECQHTDVIILLNKADLASEDEVENFLKVYEDIYVTVVLSGKTGEGTDDLVKLLGGRVCAFAGPSGTGKSTLLNRIQEDVKVETGKVSHRTRKGKHTTRHVELFSLNDGSMVFDTPGFTSFETLGAKEEDLAFMYPEMRPFLGQCKYHNCRHTVEPGCEVLKAVAEGGIHPSRYDSYLRQMKEIQEMRKF
jgi:ribosome biogenesis GTPase